LVQWQFGGSITCRIKAGTALGFSAEDGDVMFQITGGQGTDWCGCHQRAAIHDNLDLLDRNRATGATLTVQCPVVHVLRQPEIGMAEGDAGLGITLGAPMHVPGRGFACREGNGQ